MGAEPGQARTLRVRKDGTILVPKDIVAGDNLSPGESVNAKDVQLKRKGIGRRAFIRKAGSLLTVASVGPLFSWYKKEALALEPSSSKPDLFLLDQFFGPRRAQSVALVPAANFPFRPPETPSGFYPTEMEVCNAYGQSFLKDITGVRRVRDFPQIRQDDHLVLAGAQVSNLVTRTLLGNPWLQPKFHVSGSTWTTELAWNISVDGNARHERRQFGERWLDFNEIVLGSDGTVYSPRFVRGMLVEEYLLVTVLPRSSAGDQRIVVFAGLYSPATTASSSLLLKPQAELLSVLDRNIDIVNYPYYQALFKVQVTADPDNTWRATKISYVDSNRLQILWTDSGF